MFISIDRLTLTINGYIAFDIPSDIIKPLTDVLTDIMSESEAENYVKGLLMTAWSLHFDSQHEFKAEYWLTYSSKYKPEVKLKLHLKSLNPEAISYFQAIYGQYTLSPHHIRNLVKNSKAVADKLIEFLEVNLLKKTEDIWKSYVLI